MKLSGNYQLVIPKAVRQKLGLHKGQVLYVKSIGQKSLTITTEAPIDKYYGILKPVVKNNKSDIPGKIRNELDR